MQFCDALEKMQFLHIDALDKFRRAHEQLKHVCNNYILQEFRKSGAKLAKCEGSEYKTRRGCFIKCGYDNTFLVYITPLKFETTKGFAFCLSKETLWNFLASLMDALFTQSSYPSSQYQPLMVLVILSYLKKLKDAEMITPLIQPGLLLFSFNFPGLKLNLLLPSLRSGIRNAQSARNEDELTMYIMKTRSNYLLCALSDLYVCSHSGQRFTCTLKKHSEIFSYGYTINATFPKTVLEITLNGHKSTSTFIMNWIQNDPAEFAWPKIWPKDVFWCDIVAVSYGRSFYENGEPIRISLNPMLPRSCEEEGMN